MPPTPLLPPPKGHTCGGSAPKAPESFWCPPAGITAAVTPCAYAHNGQLLAKNSNMCESRRKTRFAPPPPPDPDPGCWEPRPLRPENCDCKNLFYPTSCVLKTISATLGSLRSVCWGTWDPSPRPPPPCVTFRLVVAPLRGPGQSPVLPFACCVGSLLSVGRCGRCSCWCRFRVRGAQ